MDDRLLATEEIELQSGFHFVVPRGGDATSSPASEGATPLVAAKHKASPIRRRLAMFDQFKFVPLPRHQAGEQFSIRGFVGTVVLLMFILAYIGITTVRFFT